MFDLCRICLYSINESDCVSVFHKINDNKSVLEIMKECTSIQILYEDDLPKYICAKCREKLDLLYGFRNLIINSDLHLKEKLKTKTECLNFAFQAVVERRENFTNDHCLVSDKEIKIEECMLNVSTLDENYKSFSEQSDTDTNLETDTKDVTGEIITKAKDNRPTSKQLKSPGFSKQLEKLKTKVECLNSTSQAVVGEEGSFTNDHYLANVEEFKIEPNVSFLDVNYQAFSEQKIKKLYECEKCNKILKTAKGFKNHNIYHSGFVPFSCAFCNKTFRRKWALTVHTRVHTGDKPFTCDVCQKCFGSPSSLVLHKRIHGVKKFNCEVCNKGFYQFNQLEVHMRRHTGERPFMCEICSKTFGDQSNLIRHKGRHQGQLMPCPTCGKTYKGWSCLQQHMKRHDGLKPFSCNECGQKFTEHTSLNRHKLLHAGIKPYKCKICEKSFSQGSILFRHMRMHSGEKPFHCTLCPKEFAYKHHLQGHMKGHHKDDLAMSDSDTSDDSQNVMESTNSEPASVI